MTPKEILSQSRARKLAEKLRREEAILSDYEQGCAVPGAFAYDVVDLIRKRYRIASRSTVYSIIRRTRRRLGKEDPSC